MRERCWSAPRTDAVNRRRIWILVLLTPVVLITAARLALPWWLRTRLIPAQGHKLGYEVTVEDISLSLLRGGALLEGLRVATSSGVEHLRVKSVAAQVDLRSLREPNIVVESAEIAGLEFYHWLGGPEAPAPEPEGTTPEDTGTESTGDAQRGVLVRAFDVVDSRLVLFDLERVPSGPAFDLRAIELHVRNWQVGERHDPIWTGTVDLDASLVQRSKPALVSVIGWQLPAGGARTAQTLGIHAALTGLDLASFPAYVDSSQRKMLGQDRIDLVASTELVGDTILRGAVIGTIAERSEPLSVRFSGPISHPTFDASGSLAALFELPFARLGTPGVVVWDTSSAVVGGAVDAVSSLAKADLVGVGTSVVGAAEGAATSIGKGISGAARGIGSLFGKKDRSQPTEPPQAVHPRLREALQAERERALEEAGKASPDKSVESASR
jgi:hypothetical protein